MSTSLDRTLVGTLLRGLVRALGVILGLALAYLGLAMSQALVMLPLGLLVGCVGVLLVISSV